MTNKTALVTGANKGIGLSVASLLAEAGYTVWLAARDRARGEAAAATLRGDVRYVQLDVTDAASVERARAQVEQQTPALDLLINNAGVYLSDGDGAPSRVSLAAFRATFAVNVDGPLRVTQAFLPLCARAAAARIVMVSSGLGSLTWQSEPERGLAAWPVVAYNASKTALDALVVAFANELAATPIRVTGVNPGFVATDLNSHTGTGSVVDGAHAVLLAAERAAQFHGRVQDGDAAMPW